jgi:hypothetical protein
MTTWTRPVAWAAVVATLVLAGFSPAQDKEKPKPAAPPKKPTVMQRKLVHAQKVLEALALNDFAKMGDQAGELQQCAKEASWKVVRTPRYELYSNDFVRYLDDLRAAAKAKNTEAAALAYVEITLVCVKCHQHVREEGVGAAPDLSRLGPKAVAAK